jgi:hypothetical protein
LKPVPTSLFIVAAATGSKTHIDTANHGAAVPAAFAIPRLSNANVEVIALFPMLLLIVKLIIQINLAYRQA